MERLEQWEKLLYMTRDDDNITGWTERIAQEARRAGLLIAHVNWRGSPAIVASNVLRRAETEGKTDILLKTYTRSDP